MTFLLNRPISLSLLELFDALIDFNLIKSIQFALVVLKFLAIPLNSQARCRPGVLLDQSSELGVVSLLRNELAFEASIDASFLR